MAEGHAAADDEIRDLVGWFAALAWPLQQAAVVDRAAALGWTVTTEDQAGVAWETGLIGDRPWASASLVDEVVASLRVTTARVSDEAPAALRLIADAFADQVATTSELLGPPRARKPGRTPSVEWDLPSGAALKVLGGGRSCSWVLTSPEFVEIKRDLAGRGR